MMFTGLENQQINVSYITGQHIPQPTFPDGIPIRMSYGNEIKNFYIDLVLCQNGPAVLQQALYMIHSTIMYRNTMLNFPFCINYLNCETETGNVYSDAGFNSEAVRLVLILLYLASNFSHFTTFAEVYNVRRLVW